MSRPGGWSQWRVLKHILQSNSRQFSSRENTGGHFELSINKKLKSDLVISIFFHTTFDQAFGQLRNDFPRDLFDDSFRELFDGTTSNCIYDFR